MTNPRILFLFTNSRDTLIASVKNGTDADTNLRGFNHVPGAEQRTVPSGAFWSVFLIPTFLRYDAVITTDHPILGLLTMCVAWITGSRTKWFLIALNTSTLIRRFGPESFKLRVLGFCWKQASKIICISKEQIEDFVACDIPKEKLSYIPYGVDADYFKMKKSSEDYIVSVGRDRGRDYETLLAVAEKCDHSFVIVASRNGVLPERNFPSNVEVRYDRPLSEIRELYRHARLAVVPSKDQALPEGSDCSGQTVILDALSAGLPVIATERSWIRDYFVPGVDLEVVKPADSNELSKEIETLWNDPERRQLLAQHGMEKVCLHYTTKQFAHAVLNLI
jgi:glycosyltransferase involved in cell wall biosynthesis